MDKIYKHLLRLVLTALPLACVAALASCGFEDEADGCPDNEPATVQISVSAGEIGDLNGTRVGGDEKADQHEFMHSLYVYIIDGSGNIVQKFDTPIATGYNDATTGDLVDWTSEPFELNSGTYTIYAFANFEGHTGITDDNQTGQNADYFITSCFGENKNLDALDQFRLIDPAGKIKLTAGDGQAVFIPMSAKEQVQVTPTTTMLSVDLVRLVSKVKLTMPADDITQDAASLTFSNYSTNVPLLGELYTPDDDYSYNTNTTYYGDRTASTTELLSSATPDSDGNITASLYVNETNTGNPFTVTLSTGKSGNGDVSAYVAKTQRTDIPRNSIYPLSLTFPDFGFNLTPTAWLYVTGVPYAVYYSVEENAFKVEIATGSFFNLAPGNVTDSDGEHQATWTWTVPKQQYEGLNISLNQDGVIEGNVPAGNEYIGYKYTLHLNGKWTDNAGHSFDRSYTVVVDVCHNEAWAIANRIQGGTTTRGAKAEAPVYMLAPENLNMFKMK